MHSAIDSHFYINKFSVHLFFVILKQFSEQLAGCGQDDLVRSERLARAGDEAHVHEAGGGLERGQAGVEAGLVTLASVS